MKVGPGTVLARLQATVQEPGDTDTELAAAATGVSMLRRRMGRAPPGAAFSGPQSLCPLPLLWIASAPQVPSGRCADRPW